MPELRRISLNGECFLLVEIVTQLGKFGISTVVPAGSDMNFPMKDKRKEAIGACVSGATFPGDSPSAVARQMSFAKKELVGRVYFF